MRSTTSLLGVLLVCACASSESAVVSSRLAAEDALLTRNCECGPALAVPTSTTEECLDWLEGPRSRGYLRCFGRLLREHEQTDFDHIVCDTDATFEMVDCIDRSDTCGEYRACLDELFDALDICPANSPGYSVDLVACYEEWT